MKLPKPKLIYVDVDGTICIQENRKDFDDQPIDYSKNEPIPERIKQINELYDKGHGNDGEVDQELAIDISKRILSKEVLDEAKRKQEEYDKDAKPKQEFNELLSKAGHLYFDEIIKSNYYLYNYD